MAPLQADAFRAVAEPTRRAILDELARGDRSVTELCALFDVSQPAISQHLRVLREAGLVEPRREGRRQIYRLEPEALRPVRDWVAHYERFWSDRLDALGAVLDAEAARTKRRRGSS
jgi:DNA-binding transcriptional ArsR family regulator